MSNDENWIKVNCENSQFSQTYFRQTTNFIEKSSNRSNGRLLHCKLTQHQLLFLSAIPLINL